MASDESLWFGIDSINRPYAVAACPEERGGSGMVHQVEWSTRLVDRYL